MVLVGKLNMGMLEVKERHANFSGRWYMGVVFIDK
jgi:hypothetical protein